MSKADLVGNYVGRLCQANVGKTIYIKQKGELRDQVMEGIQNMLIMMNIPFEQVSPARIRRSKPTVLCVDPAAPGTVDQSKYARIYNMQMQLYNSMSGRQQGKSHLMNHLANEAFNKGFTVQQIDMGSQIAGQIATHVFVDDIP